MSEQNSHIGFWQESLLGHSGQLIDADNNIECSYKELDELIESFVLKIPEKRQLVALIADNSLAFVIVYLALLRHQHVILLLEKGKIDESSTNIGLSSYASIALSVKNKALVEQYTVNYLISGDSVIKCNSAAIKMHPCLALLLSTSGSTGSPKQVKLSYQNLIANTESICQFLPIESEDTVVTTLPLHYSFGLSVLHTHLTRGATIILTNATPLDKQLWQLYKHYHPSSFYGVPFSFSLINKLDLQRLPLNSIRYFAQAGGKLSQDLVLNFSQWCDEYNKQLFIMYGQTEATARIAYLSPDKATQKLASIGQAIPSGKIQLRDNNNEEITSSGVSGELYYQGNNVFIGYANTTECLAIKESIDWLATGDIANFDDDGDFFITGRSKRIIKVVGKRINLEDIELFLKEHVTIECVVTGEDENLNIHISEMADGDIATYDNLKAMVADYAQINLRYITLSVHSIIPRLANGKIAYSQLEKRTG